MILVLSPAAAAAESNDLLTAAVEYGDLETVRGLLVDGDDANKTTEGGESLLRLAGRVGHREIGALLFHFGASVSGVLNASGVRIRDRAGTRDSNIVGRSDSGETVAILAKSREQDAIQGMVAHWYRIRKEDGTTGYSYGFFFDVDPWELEALPTFYENDRHGFRLQLPASWDGFLVTERLVRFGHGVEAPVIYLGMPAQPDLFAISALTAEQWEILSRVDGPEGVSAEPSAQNRRYRFDYSWGHHVANDEMHRRLGEVNDIMKTLETFEPLNE